MGAIAESMVAYAQPLLDETDGSLEQVNKAFAIAQLCWNLALFPEEQSKDLLAKAQSILKMNDDEFEQFRRRVILPMIRRHSEMFPNMPRLGSNDHSNSTSGAAAPKRPPQHAGTGRNEPCPCNSGKKYKRCCGR